MRKFLLILIIVVVAGVVVYQATWDRSTAPEESEQTPSAPAVKNSMHRITLKTNLGEIQFETYDADAPKAAANFVKLAQEGFYNGLTFHRVIPGFMIQGGDPNCTASRATGPCGTGGPGYQFEDELNPNTESYQNGYRRGVVAMANAGPNTNGSQFFILHADYPLPHNYTIFGKVVAGQEVVDQIATVKRDSNDRPLMEVIIQRATAEALP